MITEPQTETRGSLKIRAMEFRLQEPGGPSHRSAQKGGRWLQPAARVRQYAVLEPRIRIYHILGARTLEHAATCDLPDSGRRWERRNLSLPDPPDQNLLSATVPP